MHEKKQIQKLQLNFLKITIHVFFYFIIKEARTIFKKLLLLLRNYVRRRRRRRDIFDLLTRVFSDYISCYFMSQIRAISYLKP